jgi:hypothetical protein
VVRTKPSVGHHKDGTIWNKGQTLDGEMHGYWEWFRKDGVIMRSGHFDRGQQAGEWTTYNAAGKPHKVTQMKTPAPKASARKPAAKVTTKAPAKPKAKAEPTADALMASLDHPLKAEIDAARKAILSVDKSIADGVKWNSLSFRTTEWFATVNLRSRDSLQLILHLGAKAGKTTDPASIPDPKGLLKWLGKDRAMATLGAGPALKANIPALKAITKAWIRAV